MLTNETPIRSLKGVGDARNKLFAAAGILTAGDLLQTFPRSYQNRSDIKLLLDVEADETAAVIATIDKLPVERRSAKGLYFVTAMAHDESGSLELTFFNMRWVVAALTPGRSFRFYGRVERTLYGAKMVNPITEAIYPGKVLKNIVPVYPLHAGLTQGMLTAAIGQVLCLCDSEEDVLHSDIIDKYKLMHRGEAIKTLHAPEDAEALALARRTLAFEELFVFQLALIRMKSSVSSVAARPLSYTGSGIRRFFDALPYKLTDAQGRAVKEILSDLCRETPMMRLLQGDVGSGKTVVAAAAMYFAVKNGGQAALMAPTEILAQQHFRTLSKLLSPFEITVELLVGSTSAAEKARIKQGLADGSIAVAVGTHALLQGDVTFSELLLAVTDEQHRFGVMQRALLAGKGKKPLLPHTLVMSATPIPRTLSLILYGDLDFSIINEMPPGRQKIITSAFNEGARASAYRRVRSEIDAGHQAYIICPLVEESDDGGKHAAEGYLSSLSGTSLEGIAASVVHGRLSAKEKNARMQSFAEGETKLLISTTVVEVGVDVPNATVMLIENCECFGLSQLHQLRGRVGRGNSQSYCLLISGSESKRAKERIAVMCSTSDGYEIAEADLKQRGPGDFFGSRQSGELSFAFAGVADMELIAETGQLARSVPEGLVTYATERAVERFFAENQEGRIFN